MMLLRLADLSTTFKSVPKQVPKTDYVSLFLAEDDIGVIPKVWNLEIRKNG